MCANINTGPPPGGGESAFVGLSIDGGAPGTDPTIEVTTGAGSGGIGASASTTYLLGGLSQGSHSFKMKYRVTTSGVSGFFLDRLLSVQPL